MALKLAGDLSTCYFLILLTLLTQLLALEDTTPRQAWTCARQLNAGLWAEVLGSELTNLLCMVGVTGGVLGAAREGRGGKVRRA